MTRPARSARARARGFLPVLYTQRRGHCERGPPRAPAPPAPHAPAPPARHTLGFFTFLTPREGARAGLGAVPLRPALPPGPLLPPGPTLRPLLLPMGTISAITFPHGPGRAGSSIWALRPSHPAGLGFVGISFVAFYEESRTPPRSPPHPQPSAHRAQEPRWLDQPRTRAPGPLPFPSFWGGEMGASPHHTCGCSHIPLSIPGKIKRQNCTRAGCSLQKKPPLPCAWGTRGGGRRVPEPRLLVWGKIWPPGGCS